MKEHIKIVCNFASTEVDYLFSKCCYVYLISVYIVNSLSQHLKIDNHTSFGQLKLTVRFSKCCYS